MKNTIGNNVSLTIWGESHGKSIGAVLDGICAGIEISEEFISDILTLRRPTLKNSTARCEKDNFSIESGKAQRLRQRNSFSEPFKSPLRRFSTPEISHIFAARALGKSPEREVLTSLSGVSFAKFSNICA